MALKYAEMTSAGIPGASLALVCGADADADVDVDVDVDVDEDEEQAVTPPTSTTATARATTWRLPAMARLSARAFDPGPAVTMLTDEPAAPCSLIAAPAAVGVPGGPISARATNILAGEADAQASERHQPRGGRCPAAIAEVVQVALPAGRVACPAARACRGGIAGASGSGSGAGPRPGAPGPRTGAGADRATEQDRTVIVAYRTDDPSRRCAHLRRVNRKPWPEMIAILSNVLNRYQAVSAHDGTGIGNFVIDLIDEWAHHS